MCDYLEGCPYIPIIDNVAAWMKLPKAFEPRLKELKEKEYK